MFSVKPPKIKTRTITVKKTPATTAGSSPSARTPSIARTSSTNGTSSARKASTPVPPASRYRLSSAPVQSKEPPRQSLSVSRVHQRKRKVTPTTPQWASSDESSDDDNEDDDRLGVKRQKTRLTSTSTEPMNLNRCLDPDLKRHIRIQEECLTKQGNGASIEKRPVAKKGKLVHGMEMTLGEFAKEFKSAFPGSDKSAVLELQYPSTSRPEKFEAVMPLDRDEGYNPLEDIYFSIEEMIQNYFPEDMVTRYASDVDGPVRLLKRAVSKNSLEDFEAALDDFNNLIRDKLSDGTIPKVMDDMHAIPLSLVKRITAQTYQRIVSPQAHRLRKVRGKETTYGELLPPFVHKIFHQTGLNSSSVFVDLGSGVGNVVLQSSLQTGAESWGIEIMELAASLGTKQASELRARARLWNIALGPMHLLKGSFFESPEIDDVLRRADVVLVNNKVFGQKINNELLQKFLDLKEGCKVVSLESFGGGAKQGVRNEQSIAGLFDEEQFESGTASVSWAGESVEYFIATKAR